MKNTPKIPVNFLLILLLSYQVLVHDVVKFITHTAKLYIYIYWSKNITPTLLYFEKSPYKNTVPKHPFIIPSGMNVIPPKNPPKPPSKYPMGVSKLQYFLLLSFLIIPTSLSM